MVHRFMALYLNHEYNYTALTRLPGQTKHCSNMEKKAAEAERASIKYKQVEYLSDKVGQEFEGIISGVTRWGLYVELIESKSDGMIPMAELSGDYYEVDEKNFRLVGRNTGEVINMGDRVLVQVKSTSLMLRQIEFSLVDILSQPKRNIPDYVPGFREEPRRKGSSRSRNAGPKSAPKKGKGGGRNTGQRIESKGKRNAKKGGKRK
jgi:ribonuclease R